MAREQLVHVEPGASGAWVAHIVVMRLYEDDHEVRGADGKGGEGLEATWEHACERASLRCCSARQGCVHPAKIVMISLDNEGLAVDVVAHLLDTEEDRVGLLFVGRPAGGLLAELV